MRLLLRHTLGAALAATAAAGCSLGSTTETPPAPQAAIRIVQVVSDVTTGVDVSLGSIGSITGLVFEGYYPPPNSAVNYAVVPATPPLKFSVTGSSTPFYNQPGSAITAGGVFTVVALGRTAAGATPPATVTVLADTISAGSTNVLFRVFNAVDYAAVSSTGNPVDVYIYPQGSARPQTPDVAALQWNAHSAYIPKAPGNLQVDVFLAGAPSTGTPLFSTTFDGAAAGMIRTLVLHDPPPGSVAGTTGGVLVLNDQG